jgi:ABC-2 type transport system permease protein
MKALLIREIKSFFGSPIGYLVVGLFLLMTGLFLWVFTGDFNILNSGYADLSPFFKLTPWIFIFLIPAITMRSFSEEIKQGTIELLFTKPISLWQIVLGKYLGAFTLVLIALLPTLLYVWVLSNYGAPAGSIDLGSTWGSYFGLLFLASTYISIGVFTSTLTENQIVSFILAVLFSFIVYYGFEAVSNTFNMPFISNLGIESHFTSMSRGVIDTRDLIYFISSSFLLLYVTVFQLKRLKK